MFPLHEVPEHGGRAAVHICGPPATVKITQHVYPKPYPHVCAAVPSLAAAGGRRRLASWSGSCRHCLSLLVLTSEPLETQASPVSSVAEP